MGEPHNKTGKGGFVPGDPRINRGGAPRQIKQVREMLSSALPQATQVLLELLAEDDPKIRLAAAREIYDRVLGKPREHIEISHVEQELEVLKALPEPEFRAQLLALVNQTQTEKEPA